MTAKINKKFGFDQWGKIKENCYFGCYNDCRYCNVKALRCTRMKFRPVDSWYLMELNKRSYNKGIGRRSERTLFPTSHDIFPFNRRNCFKFIKKIIHPKEKIYNEILITSKPRFSVFKSFPEYFKELKDHIQVRFTITTNNVNLLKYWEGNSSLFRERLKCLDYCYEHEIKTSVSIEPFLDDPEDLYVLVDTLKNSVSETIWIGHMNRIRSTKRLRGEGTPIKEIEQYKRIRHNKIPKKLVEIVKTLQNFKMVRYKESFLNTHYNVKSKKRSLMDLIPDCQIPKIKNTLIKGKI